MDTSIYLKLSGVTALLLSLGTAGANAATNFVVTSPDFLYAVDGVTTTNPPGFFVDNCPTLTLYAGNTYTFTMQASALHPMVVATNASTGLPSPIDLAYGNASPQNISVGVITLTLPPTNFPSTLYYQCNVHGFYGMITVLPPSSAPPPNTILGLTVTTNIVLISTGTNTTYKLVPQFSSNLVNGAWAPVPSFTNTVVDGTNYTVFDRLDPICGPNVFLRISQQPP